MKKDIAQIKSSNDLFIFAGETNNLNKSSSEEYQKLPLNYITKPYQKSTELFEKAVNIEAKHISKMLDLDNRNECIVKNPAFVSLKDHKPNIQSSLPCWFVNPSKSDIRKISKSALDKTKQSLRNKLLFNKWKSLENVINWSRKIKNKNHYVLIKFDIAKFHASVSETNLRTAI